jgi:hypothetical protein
MKSPKSHPAEDHGQNHLLVKSARCGGTNAALFNLQRLSNIRDSFLSSTGSIRGETA